MGREHFPRFFVVAPFSARPSRGPIFRSARTGNGTLATQAIKNRTNCQLLVFSVTPFKIAQNKKSKPFNRLSLESGNRKKLNMQSLAPRFRSQQFFLWEICRETFSPNL